MTRINTVPPRLLSNEHLRAEYRELPRIFTLVRKHVAAGRNPNDLNLPMEFCLGRGHQRFFYDKCSYLIARYYSLIHELTERGFNLNQELCDSVLSGAMGLPDCWKTSWTPSPADHYLCMSRLANNSKLNSVYDELDAGYATRHDSNST